MSACALERSAGISAGVCSAGAIAIGDPLGWAACSGAQTPGTSSSTAATIASSAVRWATVSCVDLGWAAWLGASFGSVFADAAVASPYPVPVTC